MSLNNNKKTVTIIMKTKTKDNNNNKKNHIDVYHRCFKLMNSPKWNPEEAEAECSIRSSEQICISPTKIRAVCNMDTQQKLMLAETSPTAATKPLDNSQSHSFSLSLFERFQSCFYLYSRWLYHCYSLQRNKYTHNILICSKLVRAHMPWFWSLNLKSLTTLYS